MLLYAINTMRTNNCIFFGITVFFNEKVIKNIPSLSKSKNDIENLVNMCNELKIEECHIDDIVEDFLTDFKI